MQSLAVIAVVLVTTTIVSIIRRRRYRSLRSLRGPKPPSWIFGHEVALTRQTEVGELDFAWTREYGATYPIGGHFGTEILMTADPKALQHIFHKSGYNYGKRKDISEGARQFLGPGIATVEGEIHQRHRKVMNPAFSAPQLRSFLNLFQDIGSKMYEKWKTEVVDGSDKTTFVNKWLARTTLDIIGQAAFDHDYGALDNTESPLSKAYSNLFIKSALYPAKWMVLYRDLWNYLPDPLLRLTQYTPTRQSRHFRRVNRVVNKIGSELFQEKMKDISDTTKEGRQKDVLSVLIRANMSENPKTQLKDEEMMAQMQTLTFAGHETTASTLSWMFWEAAKKPAYQARMRAEIRETRAAVVARGDDRFTMEDLDSMTTVVNAIKETLRMHPIVFNLQRIALKDDILPLSEPITSKTGEIITAIPIKAGQWFNVSLCAYNRLPSVWGDDAEEWNPDRFERIDPTKQTRVGVFANLMSFSAGVRGCIGWRFSLIEMQALAAELLERFEFHLPKEQYEIVRLPAGIMLPIVRGKLELGAVMPLRVSLAQ